MGQPLNSGFNVNRIKTPPRDVCGALFFFNHCVEQFELWHKKRAPIKCFPCQKTVVVSFDCGNDFHLW